MTDSSLSELTVCLHTILNTGIYMLCALWIGEVLNTTNVARMNRPCMQFGVDSRDIIVVHRAMHVHALKGTESAYSG